MELQEEWGAVDSSYHTTAVRLRPARRTFARWEAPRLARRFPVLLRLSARVAGMSKTAAIHRQHGDDAFAGAVLLGGGEQAALLLDLLEWSGCDWRSLSIYDDRLPLGETGPRGLAVAGDLSAGVRQAVQDRLPALVALGSKQAALRDCLHEALAGGGATIPSIVHPATLAARRR